MKSDEVQLFRLPIHNIHKYFLEYCLLYINVSNMWQVRSVEVEKGGCTFHFSLLSPSATYGRNVRGQESSKHHFVIAVYCPQDCDKKEAGYGWEDTVTQYCLLLIAYWTGDVFGGQILYGTAQTVQYVL